MRQGSFIQNFDVYAQIVSHAVKSGRKVWSGDFVNSINQSRTERRAAQRNLRLLEIAGYLTGDDCVPKGYTATDKAKKVFGVQA